MALYHSYRPQSFDDVLGQPHVVGVLKSAIAHDRVGHAYLFSGPRGVGKTSIARILAKAINCQNRESRITNPESGTKAIPCNDCKVCKSITDGSALDVIEIDAASNRGIDEIRELRDRVRFAPTELAKKVYIIDEVHMLTKEAFNALLKTLEEPPEHAVFVLATTELQKIPETILSRCQHFQFRRANPEAIGKHLVAIAADEGRTIDSDALELLVLRSEGSYRDALSGFEQLLSATTDKAISAVHVRDLFGLPSEETAIDTLAAIAVGDRQRILEILESLSAQGLALEGFMDELIRLTRQILFIATLGPARFSGGSERLREALPGLLDAMNITDLVQLLTKFSNALVAMRTSPLPMLPIELALLSLASEHVSEPVKQATAPVVSAAVNTAPSTSSPVVETIDTAIEQPPVTVVVAEPTVSAAKKPSTDPLPVSASELTHENWRTVRQGLIVKDSSLTMLLTDRADPPRLEGNRATLDVPYKFHVDRLMAGAQRRAIEAALSDLLGRPVEFACEVATQLKQSATKERVPSAGPVVEDVVGALSEL